MRPRYDQYPSTSTGQGGPSSVALPCPPAATAGWGADPTSTPHTVVAPSRIISTYSQHHCLSAADMRPVRIGMRITPLRAYGMPRLPLTAMAPAHLSAITSPRAPVAVQVPSHT